jgi:hypothetical protein
MYRYLRRPIEKKSVIAKKKQFHPYSKLSPFEIAKKLLYAKNFLKTSYLRSGGCYQRLVFVSLLAVVQ